MNTSAVPSPNAKRRTLDVNFAAVQVLHPAWFKRWELLGLAVVILQVDTQIGSPIHEHPLVEEGLGKELEEIGAGHFDSTFYHPGSAWHFYLCRPLAAAVQRLKSQLDIRGLLPVASIMHAEGPDHLTVWWSSDPAILGKVVEPDDE